MADEIILHHYWNSPFSEKVRLLLGIKGLAWRGVIQPVIMPKPDLIPLTGGYRRIPVMQIGADVFLDSSSIMAEIERRHPEPRVIAGADWAINAWADRVLFQPTVAIIFGAIGGAIDPAFVKDREAMSGRPFDAAAMKAAGPSARGQFRAALAWLDDQLGARGPYVGGERPSLGDIAFWLNVWFYGNVLQAQLKDDLAAFPRASAWRERIASIGCGAHSEMSAAEALRIAAASEPDETLQIDHDPADPSGLSPGASVVVSADDYGRDPIAGSLVAASPGGIVISRHSPELGRLNLHFPRAGYVLSAA
ncbi:MAG TPA: glutathione S-transferase family protein [Caulobacteraceae bacterium]|jgi:glutathione S-transferase